MKLTNIYILVFFPYCIINNAFWKNYLQINKIYFIKCEKLIHMLIKLSNFIFIIPAYWFSNCIVNKVQNKVSIWVVKNLEKANKKKTNRKKWLNRGERSDTHFTPLHTHAHAHKPVQVTIPFCSIPPLLILFHTSSYSHLSAFSQLNLHQFLVRTVLNPWLPHSVSSFCFYQKPRWKSCAVHMNTLSFTSKVIDFTS